MTKTAIAEFAGATQQEKGAKFAPGHFYPSPATQGVDVDDFLLDVIKAKNLDIDLSKSITSGSITRSMGGASTIEVTVSDHRHVLLESDLWVHDIDVKVNSYYFRLAQVSKQGDDITLTFEDRIVAIIRSYDKPIKVKRGATTRAEFILLLVRKVKELDIRFFCPQLHKKQPVAGRKKTDAERNANKDPGLRKSFKVKLGRKGTKKVKSPVGPQGLPGSQGGSKQTGTFNHDFDIEGKHATVAQLGVLQDILDVGYDMGANKKCLIAAIMTAIQESKLSTAATNGTHVGVFQQDPRYWPATRNTRTDAKAFFKALIANDKKNPNYSFAELAESVQASGQGELYAQWEDTAKQILGEYGTQGGDTSREVLKAYQFTVGPPDGPKNEDYWQAMLRLAAEVRWRVFVVGNTLYYVSDKDLMAQKPLMDPIDEDTDGIESIDFDWDVNKRNNEATINAVADRWFAPPGSVIVLQNCGPADGRWLVWEVRRDLFTPDTTITLKKAQPPKKEPAAQIVSKNRSDTSDIVLVNGKIKGKLHGTPKQIIDQIVLPIARKHGINVTPGSVTAANAVHGHTVNGTRSDHEGPPEVAWAADMSNGSAPTPEMDALANDLARLFGFPVSHAKDNRYPFFPNVSMDGYRIQLGYRTNVGGNHYNHVHCGIRATG